MKHQSGVLPLSTIHPLSIVISTGQFYVELFVLLREVSSFEQEIRNTMYDNVWLVAK